MSSSFFTNPRSNPELRSLYQIALLPAVQTPLEDYFFKVMTIVAECFPIRYSALVLRDSQKGSLRVEGVYGLGKDDHPLGCKAERGTIPQVLESQQPMVIRDLAQEPLYEEVTKGPKKTDRIQAPLLCIPLTAGGEAIGTINISPLYGPRNELIEDYQFLSILSAILSPVIKQHQIKRDEALAKSDKTKSKSSRLEEVLGERLGEVLNKVDPYLEAKLKSGLLDDIVALVEKILIQSALDRVDYVQVAAAQLLGINRNTLRKKMKDLKVKSR